MTNWSFSTLVLKMGSGDLQETLKHIAKESVFLNLVTVVEIPTYCSVINIIKFIIKFF